jgi:cell division protein FtsB
MQAPEIIVPRRSGRRPGGRSMRTMGLVASVIVGAWLLAVFGSALARSDAIEQEARAVRAENAALVERIAAGQREVELIQTEAFLSIRARAFGMGVPRERPFALASDAPPRVEIVPLGEDPAQAVPATPLEEWLELLFG